VAGMKDLLHNGAILSVCHLTISAYFITHCDCVSLPTSLQPSSRTRLLILQNIILPSVDYPTDGMLFFDIVLLS
jgi:hypothetical protein